MSDRQCRHSSCGKTCTAIAAVTPSKPHKSAIRSAGAIPGQRGVIRKSKDKRG